MADFILCIILKSGQFFLRTLPLKAWLFLARGFGWFYYYCAGRKNKKAYIHLKLAFGGRAPQELRSLTRQMYQNFAQNLMETLYLPFLDEKYIKKFIRLSGVQHVEEALKNKSGIIFLGCHAGSWELSNMAMAMLFSAEGGFALGEKKSRYAMLVQPQTKHKRLNDYLNNLREEKGCHVIGVNELKKMVEHLSNNHMLGTVIDHGGKDGVPIEFFGKLAMTPTSSIKLAKKLNSQIILAFMHRVKGPTHEIVFKPHELVSTGDAEQDLKVNLTQINRTFQDWISQYPQEYLWLYKRWKYSPQKNILVLSDGKLGHLKQSLSLLEIIKSLGLEVKSDVIEVKYKTARLKSLLTVLGFLFGPKIILSSLVFCLEKDSYKKLMAGFYDVVISAGSSLAALNLALVLENNAKSIVLMKPGLFNTDRFDCVIVPEHDRPPCKKNILVTVGSLNAVNPESIHRDFQRLSESQSLVPGYELEDKPKIGLLIGGNSKNYRLTSESVSFLCQQLRKALDEIDGYLFLTTSPRTPKDAVDVLRLQFKNNPRCKLFVVANEFNPPGAVGGIFYLSDIVIVSGESISMVSEAAASGKYVIVFEPRCEVQDNKVKRFLNSLVQKNYIYLVKLNDIYDKLIWVIKTKPLHSALKTDEAVREALRKIL